VDSPTEPVAPRILMDFVMRFTLRECPMVLSLGRKHQLLHVDQK